MKKVIALILALVLCLSLCACGGGSSAPKTTGTPLTLDNYKDYLTFRVNVSEPSFTEGLSVSNLNFGNGIRYDSDNGSGFTFVLYDYFNISASAIGVSTNFNYNDVMITVLVKVNYKTVDIDTNVWTEAAEYETELVFDCNIAGNGGESAVLQGTGKNMLGKMMEYSWEVIDISGTVTPAG